MDQNCYGDSGQDSNSDKDAQTEDMRPLAHKAPSTAANTGTAALHVTEILEMILLFLPLRKIVQVKEVNKSWHNTVEGSINLQRALFLAPLNGSVAQYRAKDKMARQTIMNKIGPVKYTAAKLVPEVFADVGRWIHPTFERKEKPTFIMNPLLRPFLRNVRTSSKDNMGMELDPDYCTLKNSDLDAKLGPNWRTALLVQPARSSCSVICSCLRRGELAETSWDHPAGNFGLFWVENETGITMGDLVDQIHNHRQSCRGANWQVGENVNLLSGHSYDIQWLAEGCTGADVLTL